MTKIIDGKSISEKILSNLKNQHDEIIEKHNTHAGLAVILVGNDKASQVYVRNKERACSKVGIKTITITMPETSTKEEIINKIKELNADENIDGILLQMPLPKHLNSVEIIENIDFRKDVDGLTAKSLGNLVLNLDGFKPCTAQGIIKLLKEYNIEIEGANTVIVGRSNIVGKPLANMLINLSATVQVCHTKTKNLYEKLENADIVIVAVGVKHLIKAEHLKKGAVIIDVGINRVESKLYGDVDFENVIQKNEVSYITPVPGGVGPMTIACLMENIINSKLTSINKYSRI